MEKAGTGEFFWLAVPNSYQVTFDDRRVKLQFREVLSSTGANLTKLECSTATFLTTPPAVVGEVALADGTSCDLVAEAEVGPGNAIATYSATLSRAANLYTLTSGTITGGPFDEPPPTPTITSAPATHDGVTPFDITYTFSEAVYNFDISRIFLDYGTAALKSGVDGGTEFIVTITPYWAEDVEIDTRRGLAFDSDDLASIKIEDELDVEFESDIPVFTKFFSPASIPVGGTSTLTFELDHRTSGNAASQLDFTDIFPTNGIDGTMKIAAVPNVQNGCNSGTISATPGTNTFVFKGGTLASDVRDCTVTVDVTADKVGTYNNISGDLTSNHGNGGSTEATLKVTVPNSNLSVNILDSPDPVVGGEELTYTVTVANAGPQTAKNVVATMTLPAGVSLKSTSDCNESPQKGVPTCTLGDIGDGSSALYTVIVNVDSSTSGPIENTVSVASATEDPDDTNNEARVTTTVNALEGTITIVKTTRPAAAGDATFTYTSSPDLFDGLSLTTSNNNARSAVTTVAAGTVNIAENETEGWVLVDIDCVGDTDDGSSYDIEMASVQVDLDGDEAIVCTFTSTRDPDEVITRTSAVIRHFMNQRADILTANEPDLVSRLSRRGASGGVLDGSFNLTSDDVSSRFNLTARSSLLAINRAASVNTQHPSGPEPATEETVGAYALSHLPGAQTSTDPPVTPVPEFDIWVETTMGHIENQTSAGSFGIVHAGVDQLLHQHLLIGVMAQVDWLQIDDDTQGFQAEGLGWMVGPYVVARLDEHLYFHTSAMWGLSHNSVNPVNLYEDDFDTMRLLVRGQLTGQFSLGKLTISPMVRGLFFRETQQSYVDSLDNIIPQQTISFGRLVFGPTMSIRHAIDGGLVVEPSLALHGVWNFDPADTTDITNVASLASSQALHARIEAGLTLRHGEYLSVTGTAFYDGLGDDNGKSYGVRGRVVLPLN